MVLYLPFEPCPCPRPRVSRFGAYYPPKYTKHKKQVAEHISALELERWPENTGLHIDYVFIMKRPKYMSAKKYSCNRVLHARKPDLDNLVKTVNDVLQDAKVIHDDSAIVSFFACKMYASKGENAHIQVTIKKADGVEQYTTPSAKH